MTPLAHCWPSICLSRCHNIGIPVLTHSSLRYLHPHIQHSTPHQHFLSWFTHPEPSRNRSLAYPRATVTPGAQHRTVTRLPQSQSHFPSAQSPCHNPCAHTAHTDWLQSRWCRFHCAPTTFQERIFPLDFVRGVLAYAKQTAHRYLKGVGSGHEPNVSIPSHLIETLALPWWYIVPISLLTSGGPFSNTTCLFWLQMWVASVTHYLWQAFAKCCTYSISFHLSSESMAWETGWQRHPCDDNYDCSQELWWKYRPASGLLPMPSVG